MDKILARKPWIVRNRSYLLIGLLFFCFVIYVLVVTSGGRKLRVDRERMGIAEVSCEKFIEYVDVEGIVQPILILKVNTRETGFVKRIVCEEGMMLEKGDTILVLENLDLLRNIEDQRDEFEKQLMGFREKKIAMEQQTLNLRRQMLQADYELKRLEKSYALDQEEFRMGIKSKAQLEVAQDEYEFKRASTALQLEGLRYDSTVTLIRQELIRNDLRREKQKYVRTCERLENLVVRAPMAGQLSYVSVTPGQQVGAGSSIADIKVLSQFKIHTSLSEYYIERITTGLPATITYQQEKYSLRVTKVVPEVKNRNFEVDLVFSAGQPENVRIGKSYRVQIELGQPESVIVIPKGDFFQYTAGRWIYKLNEAGTKAFKTTVAIGRQNPKQYEVLEGLQSGDRVIISGYEHYGEAEELILD